MRGGVFQSTGDVLSGAVRERAESRRRVAFVRKPFANGCLNCNFMAEVTSPDVRMAGSAMQSAIFRKVT